MILHDQFLEIIISLFIEWCHSNSLIFHDNYLFNKIHAFFAINIIQYGLKSVQVKRKTRVKKVVYNVKKITKESDVYVKNRQNRGRKLVK